MPIKTFIIAIFSTLMFAFPAFAEQAKGMIENFDADTKTIFLSDGAEYILSDNLDVSVRDVEKGTKLTLTYQAKGEQKIVTAISVSP